MNYLVPIDFSDPSKTAAEYAASLTRVWPGNVNLVHVMETVHEDQSYIPVKTLNVKKNTVFEMVHFQENLRRKFNVRTGTDMVAGRFTTNVMKIAAIAKSNLIVVGMQGASGLREHLYGSNTMALIDESNMPILAVPLEAEFRPFRHIVYVTDYQSSEIGPIVSLGKISSKFKALMSVVSFNTRESEERVNAFRSKVREQIPFAAINFEDRHHEGSAAEGLQEFSLTESVDLIGISKAQPDLIHKIAGRDLAGEFVFNVDVPVLFFPG